MTNKNKNMTIGIVLVVMVILLFWNPLSFSSVNGREIVRNVPSTVSPGQTFTISYNPTGVSGT